MPTVFEVLGGDHLEVKRMLAELESGPTALTGASDSQLGLRKKMVEELIIEESKHEALEEMYFWPAVRDLLPDGGQLADTAIHQEQEGKEVLDLLDKLKADQPEFEGLISKFIPAGREHISVRRDPGMAAAPTGAHRRRVHQHRDEHPFGQEDRADPPAPAHSRLTRGAQMGGARGGRG